MCFYNTVSTVPYFQKSIGPIKSFMHPQCLKIMNLYIYIWSLCDPGTVVPSMVGVSTSSTPGVAMHGTRKNFTCSAIPAHQGKAMGVSFLTSTPVRAEAGNSQTQGDTAVEEPQDRPKYEYTKEGMCLTHLN